MSTPFRPDMTIGEAQVTLRTLVDEGHVCPVCTQFAKVYRRKLHTTMARDLIAVARAGGMEAANWVEVGEVVGRTSPDLVKLRYWSLIEPRPGVRADGSSRVGWWRVTGLGLEFVAGRASVPSHARIYNGRCLSLTGLPVTIEDVLGKRFNYNELMAA